MKTKQTRSSNDGPLTLFSSEGRGWKGLEATFLEVNGGNCIPASPWHRLCMRFGRASTIFARGDSRCYQRLESHGDFEIVQAGSDAFRDGSERKFMRLMIDPGLVNTVAHDLGREPGKSFLNTRHGMRDARLEAVVWAIKVELESDMPDRLYSESLAVALATRIVAACEPQARPVLSKGQMLSTLQRKRLVEYIETALDQPLTLTDLATVAGISVSHLKTLFSRTFGITAHQYVMRARVERAKQMLLTGEMSTSQIALVAGFSHQSHMARCMQQILGVTPGSIAKLRT